MFLHIYIANIFMLNYLVAILSTVYSEMMDLGEFAFNSNKYLYIERYLIAQKDENGYSELVMYPPPINFMLVFLLPSLFDKEKMRKNSIIFSKGNFWFENIYYIFEQFFYELSLVPYIYIRNMSYIIKLSGLNLNGIKLLIFWSFCGPFFLFYNVFVDLKHYITVLSYLKLESGKDGELHDEAVKQDKIILYNELIDVMRSIYFIFLRKRYESMQSGGKLTDEPLKNSDLQSAITELEEKIEEALKEGDDDDPIIEGYTMHQDILLEAWAHFRPQFDNEDAQQGRIDTNSGRGRHPVRKAGEGFFDPDFINKLMANMCLKIYMDTKTKEQRKRKEDYKSNFQRRYKQDYEDKKLEEEERKRQEQEKKKQQEQENMHKEMEKKPKGARDEKK